MNTMAFQNPQSRTLLQLGHKPTVLHFAPSHRIKRATLVNTLELHQLICQPQRLLSLGSIIEDAVAVRVVAFLRYAAACGNEAHGVEEVETCTALVAALALLAEERFRKI